MKLRDHIIHMSKCMKSDDDWLHFFAMVKEIAKANHFYKYEMRKAMDVVDQLQEKTK